MREGVDAGQGLRPGVGDRHKFGGHLGFLLVGFLFAAAALLASSSAQGGEHGLAVAAGFHGVIEGMAVPLAAYCTVRGLISGARASGRQRCRGDR